MADNTQLSAAVGSGDTIRDFSDGSIKWPASVPCYITGGSAGAWTLQYAQLTTGLPVQPQTGSTWAVTGTFWQATQPVSAVSLPLPTGAATAANQTTANSSLSSIDTKTPALGQALAAASVPVVLTAAQLSTLTPLASVGISGSVAVTGTFWQATQPVSAASLPLPTGAATAAKQPALGVAGTASSDVLTVQGIASMTALKVDGSGVTQPVSGTFWQATQPVSGTFWQATQPVSGTVAATQSGTWNIATVTTVTTVSTVTAVTAITNALPAGTNTIGNVGLVPLTSGGCSCYSVISSGAANQDAAAIKASAGQLYGYSLFNTTASARYVKLYNLASGATSASTPFMRIYLPPTGGANMAFPEGVAMGTGISIRITTGAADSDTGACSANDVLANVIYA